VSRINTRRLIGADQPLVEHAIENVDQTGVSAPVCNLRDSPYASLKYSEAVGSIAPVSKPAIEGKGYEELMAENAALRAQLKTGVPARRAPGGRRRTAVPRA
jgi:hypothetical protein